MKITFYLTGNATLFFDCPASGPLYDQVARIAVLSNQPDSGQKQNVKLALSKTSSVTVCVDEVLAIETQPAHKFSMDIVSVVEKVDSAPLREPTKAPDVSSPGPPVKLTIGMATYDDYDGVYFTIQALRLYHPEIMSQVEFIVVDDNPTGVCAAPLKALENQMPNYRYVPHDELSGTKVRDIVFSESNGEFVMCLDCHVLVVPGALQKLLNYLDDHAESIDLLQGPLLYDDMEKIGTHFAPEWRGGMYGYWDIDEAGISVDAPPFDIPMQGCGLFACKRSAWPGFSDRFSGFGGEEGYIHEKFRQRGGRTLCLPFLRWVHRFNRPLGIPYRNSWEDRISNYLYGFSELGLDIEPITAHFCELLGEETANKIIEPILAKLESNT